MEASEDQNIPGEDLKNEIQNAAEEIVNETPQKETIARIETNQISEISTSEINEMEVHKHPHHVTHKKKWGEYLLEFIMLFLAVFLGFIAENIRESFAEHNQEKEYIHSLCENIQSDTLLSGQVLLKLKRTLNGIDSVMDALSSPGINESSNNAYRLWSRYIGFADFVYNDGTIQQLKNSGGLRLIRNKAVADSIMKYDATVRNFYEQAALMNGALADQHIYEQFFDFINLNKNIDTPVPLTEQGKKLLNEAYANRKIWKYGLTVLTTQLQDVHEHGKSTLAFIKEQYGDE